MSVRLTIELASVTTVILLIIGTPVAWLARSKTIWNEAVATIIVLPPILPQPVPGFYLLALLGPAGPGGLLASLGRARPRLHLCGARCRVGFEGTTTRRPADPQRLYAMGDRPLEAAATLRASPSCAFFTAAEPLARPAFLTSAVLGFAHTIGAFGVLMIGGNIPARTKVLSGVCSTISKHRAGTRQAG